jgi:hypothetical protein
MARCARCGEDARGYAYIDRDRYCHDDSRSCYSEQLHADTFSRLAAENAERYKGLLALLADDWGDHG